MTDEFESIRPYRDDEVAPVLQRLAKDPTLLAAVVRFRFPLLADLIPRLIRAAVSRYLSRKVSGINSVHAFQKFLESYFVRMVNETTDGFTFSGLDQVPRDRACLFVSNHRDIAMDSGFMNYALWLNGRPTSRIAIGDNLLTQPYATDLMRLNKSFVVRRNASGPKDMLKAVQLTSRYLHHSIEEGESVWIAQREGRAKDGLDRTDPALIKMFYVSQRKSGRSFPEVIKALNIVPVAVSYELDPCDLVKARELFLTARDGAYDKPGDEDLQSIVSGITGNKGRVHINFGGLLSEPPDTPEQVAAWIDVQIHQGVRVWPTNQWCAARLQDDQAPAGDERAVKRLAERVAQCPIEHRPYLLAQYANAIDQVPGPDVATPAALD